MEDRVKRNARQKELMRKRRNANKPVSAANKDANSVTLEGLQARDIQTETRALQSQIHKLEETLEALGVRVMDLEETVAKLMTAQAKVSVVHGSAMVQPLSKAAQASGRMGRPYG